MKCPTCKSDLTAGVKYCPVCGTDVESALAREQQAARAAAPTQAYQPVPPQPPTYAYDDATAVAQPVAGQAAYQQQAYQQQTYQRPSQQPGRASAGGQGGVAGRGFDTAKMSSSPKWPIVLIVALVVIIIAVLLLIFHPWTLVGGSGDAGQQGTSATTAQTAGSATTGADTAADTDAATGTDAQPAVTDGTNATGVAASAGLDNASAYTQLTAVYDQFVGFSDRIQAIVDYINNSGYAAADATDWLSEAQALLGDLEAQANTLNTMELADGSAYVQTLVDLKTLNNDLVERTSSLVDGLAAGIGGDADGATAALTRNNDANGVSIYKTEYESLYDAARPVQQ